MSFRPGTPKRHHEIKDSLVSGDVPGFNGVDETSLGYGLGIELYGHERNALTLEWIRYADNDIHNVDYKVESVNLGYLHRF
ncbi:MAG: hypothetical protein KZQ72_15985 [Candidatus Thiodiazotropha sp. (ex Cardiolucina cf. quadrata)]|nr:hypothetical protein [Candidatus Thiodiazotropha sp. (ex Cardiolucina cf. quadrata)]